MTRERSVHPPLRAPGALPARAAACAIAAACLALAAEGGAAAQRRPHDARRRATDALETVELAACAAIPQWAGRRARVGLVVLPGGHWGVAIASVTPAVPRGDHGGLAACLETALRARLGDTVPMPPRAAFVVARELEIPGDGSLAAEIGRRIDAGRSTFEQCVREHAEPRLAQIEIDARIEVRGGRVTDVGSRAELDPWHPVARCVGALLGETTDLPDGVAVVTATVTRPRAPPGTLPRHDGTEGALCSWGQRAAVEARGQYVLPEPRACRAGLVCCYGGGIAGLSSSCMRVGRHGCPRYP